MTRKDYVLIASALQDVKPLKLSSEEGFKWQDAVASLATALAKDNPNLDRARFVAACNKERP